MASLQPKLPEFETPPVSEVAISIEFTALPNWRGPHAGLYWGKIARDYPKTEVQLPLPSQIEPAGQALQPQTVRVEMMSPDLSRVWFIANPPTDLIQIQRNRFIVNWRKVNGTETYPRYQKHVRPRFLQEWKRFQEFVKEQDLGAIDVVQCELTYVNDILKGEGWNTFEESITMLANWKSRGTTGFLPPLETLSVSGSMAVAEARGRLHFAFQHVFRQIDMREAIQLKLVMRGRPASSREDDVAKWLDDGHERIVLGFVDLTSPEAQKLWKRIQ